MKATAENKYCRGGVSPPVYNIAPRHSGGETPPLRFPSNHSFPHTKEIHLYHTKQKDALLRCLEQQKSRSLTVDGVCAALAEAGEPIGRSTVYRRLEDLCREGKISRFAPEEGRSVTYRFIGSDCG